MQRAKTRGRAKASSWRDRAQRVVGGASMLGVLAVIGCALGCDDIDCGYGGPGCSAPGLEGPCGGQLVLGEPVDARFTYFDDTGTHEANVLAIRVSDADSLRVSPLRAPGSAELLGLRLGAVSLEADIEGWDRPQRFALEVVAAVEPERPDAGCASACCATRGAE